MRFAALSVVSALALLCGPVPAGADMAACESAARKENLDDQIRLYTLCLDGLRSDLRSGAYNNRGVAYMQKGDFDSALEDFTRALDYDNAWGTTYMNRAVIHAARGAFAEALADLDRAVELPPSRNRADAYFLRGDTRAAMGDFSGALADFDEVIDRDDDRLDAVAMKALLLATAPDSAVRDGAQAVALAQGLIEEEDAGPARLLLAAGHAEAGRFEDAVREHQIGMEMMRQDGLADDGSLAKVLAAYHAGQPLREPPDVLMLGWR